MNDEDDGITIAEATGKIEAVATLTPPGVHDVVESGWDITRHIVFKDYSNGAQSSSGDRDDTSDAAFKDLVPDADEKIYDIDGPTCGVSFTVNHTKETYNNFTQSVTWDGTKCSDDALWHYQALVDDDLDAANKPRTDDTVLNDVGGGHIAIPEAAEYDAR